MTQEHLTYFEEQDLRKAESFAKYAESTKRYLASNPQRVDINTLSFNKFIEKLDFNHEHCLNKYRVVINTTGLLTTDTARYDCIDDNMRTVKEAIEAAYLEIDRLMKKYDTAAQRNVQYTLIEYLKNLPENDICDESCLNDLKLAIEYDIDFDWEFPDFEQIKNEILDYEIKANDIEDTDPMGICSRADDNRKERQELSRSAGGC